MNDDQTLSAFGIVTLVLLFCSLCIGFITKSFLIGGLCLGGSILLLIGTGRFLVYDYITGILLVIIAIALINLAGSKAEFEVTILWMLLLHFCAVALLMAGLRAKTVMTDEISRIFNDLLILTAIIWGLNASFSPFFLLHHHFEKATFTGLFVAIKSFTGSLCSSPWGLFYLFVMIMVGYWTAKKSGALYFPLCIITFITSIEASYPELTNLLNHLASRNPIEFHQELFTLISDQSSSLLNGFMAFGLFWAWLLAPAFIRQLSLQKTMQAIAAVRFVFGSAIAQGYARDQMPKEGMAMAFTIILTSGSMLVVTIILWKILFLLPKMVPFTFFQLEVPDIRVPHWKPVWNYSYFVLATVWFFSSQILHRLQNRALAVSTPPGHMLGEAIAAVLFGMFVPAGIVLFYIGYLVAKILLFPFISAIMVTGFASAATPQQDYQAPAQPVYVPQQSPPFTPSPEPSPSYNYNKIQSEPVVPLHVPKSHQTQPVTGRLLFKHQEEIVDFESMGANGHLVLDCSGNISRYNSTGQCIAQLKGLVDSPLTVQLRGEKVILGDKTGKIFLGESELADRSSFTTIGTEKPFELLTTNGFGTISVCTSLDKRELFSIIHGSGKVIPLLNLDSERVTSLTFSPDNQLLAFGTKNGDIMLYSMARREVQTTCPFSKLPESQNGPSQISHLSFIESKSLFAAYSNGQLAYWQDLAYCTTSSATGKVSSLSYDAPSDRIVIGMYNGTIQIFALSNMVNPLFAHKLHETEVVKANLIGGQLVSVGRDGTVMTTQV